MREALRRVIDPELGMNWIDLGMVKQIVIAAGQVAVPEGKHLEVTPLDAPWEPPDATDWQSWVDQALER